VDEYCFLVITTISYSDLWEPCFSLIEKYKPTGVKVYIATDSGLPYSGLDFETIPAGVDVPYSTRLLNALPKIKEDYVILMLDDYFLKRPIENANVLEIIRFMRKEKLDYVNFSKSSFFKRCPKIPGTNLRKLRNLVTYDINLRLGLWGKSALEKCFVFGENPWQAEVSLSLRFTKAGCKGAVCLQKPIIYFHGVTKGLFYRRSYKSLKKAHLYHGNRKQMNVVESSLLFFIVFLRRLLPHKMTSMLKKVLKKRGKKFASE
jgi:hypothetical protein